MGARYVSKIDCPRCGSIEEVYYAPTCDFTIHRCSGCGYVIELAEYFEGIGTRKARQEHDDLTKDVIRRANGKP